MDSGRVDRADISAFAQLWLSVTVALSRLRVREGRLHSILIDRSTVKQRSPVRPQDALKANALECQGAKGPGPGRESLLLDFSFWFL